MSKADKVFYAKSGNFCIVRSGNEIKRSIFFKGKNVVIPENLKLELAKTDEIVTVQETREPNQVIFFVRSKSKLNSLITWDLKFNEEINFYQTDKPCILLPRLVENE
jgi:DNA polymerase III delta subunit